MSGTDEVEGGGEKEAGRKQETVQATYTPLPDEDSNWHAKEKMSKQNGTDGEMNDEAKERMLKDEPKAVVTPMKNASEVKFGTSNGDTKIDIEIVKQSLSGMGKEELMKYANDPFWIRLRWVMFISFWLIWCAMLAGAIYIIVTVPKCAAPAPKKWFEQSPMIELDVEDLTNHDAKSHSDLLDKIKELNIKAISLPMILETVDGNVVNFTNIDKKFGNMSDFEHLVKEAKARGQHIILEFDPNSSSDKHPWFQKSIKNESVYGSYYVWRNGSNQDGNKVAPDDQKTVDGKSAWQWNPERQQHYYHTFSEMQPDFNFENPAVVQEFKKIFEFWVDKGVSGFRLINTRYLTKDPNANVKLLREWQNIVANCTGYEGLFTLKDIVERDILDLLNDKGSGRAISIPQPYCILQNTTAKALNESFVAYNKSSTWPVWKLCENKNQDKASLEVAQSLTLMTMLLPGTPVVHMRNANSSGFKILGGKNREDLSFLYGVTKTFTLHNDTVFAYTRMKTGNPGLLVAYNSGNQEITADLSNLPSVSEDVTLIAKSSNYLQHLNNTSKLSAKTVHLFPKSTLVMSYVRKSD